MVDTLKILSGLTVAPSAPAMAVGDTITLAAWAQYSDLSQTDVTASVTFTSADPAFVTVSGAAITGVALTTAIVPGSPRSGERRTGSS